MLVDLESPRYISGVVPDAIVVVSSSDYCGSVAVLIRCKVNEVVFINLLVVPVFCVALSPSFFYQQLSNVKNIPVINIRIELNQSRNDYIS